MNWRRFKKIAVIASFTAVALAFGLLLETPSQQDHMIASCTTAAGFIVGIMLANDWFPAKERSTKNQKMPRLDSHCNSLDMVALRKHNTRNHNLIDDLDRPTYARRKKHGISQWSQRWKKHTGRSFPRAA